MKLTITSETIVLEKGGEKNFIVKKNITKIKIRGSIIIIHYNGRHDELTIRFSEVTTINGVAPTTISDLIDLLVDLSLTIVVKNSDNSWTVTIPTTSDYTVPNVTHTDSTGAPVVLPGITPMVCTPIPDSRNMYFHFFVDYYDYLTITADANSATTWTTEALTNVATVVYEKNGVAASLPIALALGDTLKVTITRTNAALESLVKLNN